MAHKLSPIVGLALAALAGCRGCGDDEGQGDTFSGAERSAQSARARILSRLSARKLDRDKTYPKDSEGGTVCGSDIDCLIVQAERCARASVEHTMVTSGFGLTQRVKARYRVTGNEAGRCKLERSVTAIDTAIDPAMVAALRKGGKSVEEIDSIRTNALDGLRRRNPARLECFFDNDQLLETLLNLADGRYEPHVWKSACREAEGPAPAIGIEAAAPPPAPAEPAAPPPSQAPAKPAGADVPVPKQP